MKTGAECLEWLRGKYGNEFAKDLQALIGHPDPGWTFPRFQVKWGTSPRQRFFRIFGQEAYGMACYRKNGQRSGEAYRALLKKRKGPEFITDMDALLERPYWTLTGFGEKWGLSKERARQIFLKLHGKPYGDVISLKKKRVEEDLKELPCQNDPRVKMAEWDKSNLLYGSAYAQMLVFDKCKELGFDVQVPCSGMNRLVINGYMVIPKQCSERHLFSPVGGLKYYRIHATVNQIKECDFMIAYVEPWDCFYVFPKKEFQRVGVYLREEDVNTYCTSRGHNYQAYREAWGQLRRE